MRSRSSCAQSPVRAASDGSPQPHGACSAREARTVRGGSGSLQGLRQHATHGAAGAVGSPDALMERRARVSAGGEGGEEGRKRSELDSSNSPLPSRISLPACQLSMSPVRVSSIAIAHSTASPRQQNFHPSLLARNSPSNQHVQFRQFAKFPRSRPIIAQPSQLLRAPSHTSWCHGMRQDHASPPPPFILRAAVCPRILPRSHTTQ